MYTNLGFELSSRMTEFLLGNHELKHLSELVLENINESTVYEEKEQGYSEEDDVVEFYMRMG